MKYLEWALKNVFPKISEYEFLIHFYPESEFGELRIFEIRSINCIGNIYIWERGLWENSMISFAIMNLETDEDIIAETVMDSSEDQKIIDMTNKFMENLIKMALQPV
jgi:hypothetical protein